MAHIKIFSLSDCITRCLQDRETALYSVMAAFEDYETPSEVVVAVEKLASYRGMERTSPNNL
jgi:hypothetical protein